MKLTVIALYLLAAVVLVIGRIILCRVHRTKQAEIGNENNKLVIGRTEVRIGLQEVQNRFFDDRMNRFLRSNFDGLKRWSPVSENRVGEHWEGDHTIRLYFFNGDSREVKVTVPEDHLTPQFTEQR